MSNRGMSDRYRTGAGMLAWILNRVTGLALTVYLVVYILSLSSAYRSGARSFSEALAGFNTPFWNIFDGLLIAALAFHTLNGIRVMLFDVGVALRWQRALFWISLVVTLAIFLLVFIKVAQNL